MARREQAGTLDVTTVIRIVDAVDGTPETGVVFNTAGIDLQYRREGAASTPITEQSLALLTTAHTDGGFLHIGNGYYRLDLPDAACAAGAKGVLVHGTVTGMVVIGEYIELVAYNPYDGVRLGLTALPAAAAEAVGGLYTRGTGAGQINQPANGSIDSRVVAFLADVITAAAIANGAIDSATFAPGAINSAAIAAGAIGASQLADGAIDRATFAADTGLQSLRSNVAQGGSGSTTIVLDTGASTVNDAYKDCLILHTIVATGIVQPRWIRAYVGSSRTASVTRAWGTTPVANDPFVILPAASVWDEFAADHVIAATFGAIEGQSLTTSELLDQILGPQGTVVDHASNSATTFQINVPTVNDISANWWKRAFISFDLTSSLAGQYDKVLSFNQTTGFVVMAEGFTAEPVAPTDSFRLIYR